MSYENYKAAMEAAKNLRFYTTAGGCSDESIRKSEDLLGIKFSSQYRDFNKQYGYLSLAVRSSERIRKIWKSRREIPSPVH